MLIVCERMGWTYQEYVTQPLWLIDRLLAKWSIEAEQASKNNQP